MDLHELFSTAVADLPDVPDQVPAAQRIRRRRTAVARSSAIAAACALVVGVGTLTFASPWSRHPADTDKTVSVAATPTPSIPANITEFKPGKRSAAPALSGITLQGKSLAVSYTGHVTVVNVWGSWCLPCRQEVPAFSEAYQKLSSKGVDFVGIDTRDNNTAALAYDSQFGVQYPSLRDPVETLLLAFKEIIPVDSVPSTVIVDGSGKVAATITDVTTLTQLDEQIAYALGAATP